MRRRPPTSAWTRLLIEPRRFRFDAAIRLLMHRTRQPDANAAAEFRSSASAAFPATEVTDITERPGRAPQLGVALIGLVGATGVLPRLYTELAGQRSRGTALHAFLDLLAQRMIGFFAAAGSKYRLHRARETAALATSPAHDKPTEALLALTGYAMPGLIEHLVIGPDPLLHYAGFFAMRPRSADRLAAMLSDWLGGPVIIEEFAGSWLNLPPDQRTALGAGLQPGAWNRLGIDAAIGVRSWDVQARIILRIGPLSRAGFEALLPDRPGHARLVSLVRAYLGLETSFAINPVLAGEAMFPALLAPGAGAPRLGWNCWTAASRTPSADAREALFEAG